MGLEKNSSHWFQMRWLVVILLGLSAHGALALWVKFSPVPILDEASQSTEEVIEISLLDDAPPEPESIPVKQLPVPVTPTPPPPIDVPPPVVEKIPELLPVPPVVERVPEPPRPKVLPKPQKKPTKKKAKPKSSPKKSKLNSKKKKKPLSPIKSKAVGAKVRKAVDPKYPRAAQRAGRRGTAVVLMNVTAKGKVASVSIVKSSGHVDLDKSAMKAAKRYYFYPAKDRSGIPIPYKVKQPFTFK